MLTTALLLVVAFTAGALSGRLSSMRQFWQMVKLADELRAVAEQWKGRCESFDEPVTDSDIEAVVSSLCEAIKEADESHIASAVAAIAEEAKRLRDCSSPNARNVYSLVADVVKWTPLSAFTLRAAHAIGRTLMEPESVSLAVHRIALQGAGLHVTPASRPDELWLMHNRVHYEPGNARPARTVRSKK